MSIARPIETGDLEAVLEVTAPLWEAARGERIFVTGGTGFFGAWLLESFAHVRRRLALDTALVVLSRRPEAFRAKMPHLFTIPGIELVAGDVRDFSFPEGTFRYVIHAATEASATQLAERPAEMLSTIFAGTGRTLQFAAEHGVRRFLLTSSGAVYGRQPGEIVRVPETYAGAPDTTQVSSIYGEGKRAAELLCSLFAQQYGVECAIARCWAFTGPHLPLDAHFAIGNFIRDALAGGPIRIAGDGTPTRSYLYGSDLAIWLWTMLFRAPSMVPYNVGSGEGVSIRELAEAVRDALGCNAAIEVARQPDLDAPISRYVPSVERAALDLGLRPQVSLHESIRRTAAWYGWTPRATA